MEYLCNTFSCEAIRDCYEMMGSLAGRDCEVGVVKNYLHVRFNGQTHIWKGLDFKFEGDGICVVTGYDPFGNQVARDFFDTHSYMWRASGQDAFRKLANKVAKETEAKLKEMDEINRKMDEAIVNINE